MRKPGGIMICTSDTGVQERDTFTCFHCNSIVVVPPKREAFVMGYCRCCDKPVCAACEGQGACVPFEERLRRAEASYHARRSYGV
jgi:hypothetical protein